LLLYNINKIRAGFGGIRTRLPYRDYFITYIKIRVNRKNKIYGFILGSDALVKSGFGNPYE